MIDVPLVILLCWAVFILYWAVTALFQKQASERPTWTATDIAARILFALPFVILVRPEWFATEIPVLTDSPVTLTIGATVCVLGLLICIWSRTALAGNWSKNIDFKREHELVQSGPYQIVRHPIYTGFLLLFLGTAISGRMLGGFIGFVLLIIGCMLRIRQEEALLTKHFKARYLEYKERTKALVPYII